MARKRLTRSTSREQTFQRLIESARRLIAKKGFTGTSVEDIAADAGYSRGAFYSNFASKDDLFIELLRRDNPSGLEEFIDLLDDKLSLDEIQAQAREFYAILYRDRQQFMYWTEARLRAIRDSRFKIKLETLALEKRNKITRFMEYFYKRSCTTSAIPIDLMTVGFIGLMEGVNLVMLSSPDLDGQASETILRCFADSLLTIARMKAKAPTRA